MLLLPNGICNHDYKYLNIPFLYANINGYLQMVRLARCLIRSCNLMS
jgi:hypothetical protein